MPAPRRMLRLPLYPWQRERFWHEAEESRVSRLTRPGPPAAWAVRKAGRGRPGRHGSTCARRPTSPTTACSARRSCPRRPTSSWPSRPGARHSAPSAASFGMSSSPIPASSRPTSRSGFETTFDPDQGTVHVHTRPVQGDRDWTVHLTAVRPSSPARGRGRRRRVLTRGDPRALPPRLFPGPVLRLPDGDRPGLRADVPGHRTGLAGGPGIARAGPDCPTPSKRTRRVGVPPGLARRLPSDGHRGRQGLRPAKRRAVLAA